MVSQNLIIYKFSSLYHILEELSLNLNFKTIYLDNENLISEKIKNLDDYLIISNKKNLNFSNQIYLENKPMNISKLIEKINIEFLKLHFNNQSHVKINNYVIDKISKFEINGSCKVGLLVLDQRPLLAQCALYLQPRQC